MIQPSGGRAGVHGYEWLKDGYSLEEIESLRQQLLAQNDIGRVLRALREFGISVKRDIIQAVKLYNFDSPKIAFTYENYTAWRRLATGQGTIGDVAYLIHEIAEVEELQRIKGQTGFDFMGRTYYKFSKKQRSRWEYDFNQYYHVAHSVALAQEYEFIAREVNRYISDATLKVSTLQAAAIDPARYIDWQTKETQAAKYMFVDGITMKEHYNYDTWCLRADNLIPLSKAMQRRLEYYRTRISLKNLIAQVRAIPIK